MKMRDKGAMLAVTLALATGTAMAQDMRTASENVVACQAVTDSAARLACFEAAATELSIVLATPEPAPLAEAAPVSPAAPVEQAAVTSPEVAPIPGAPEPAATAPVQQAAATTTEAAPREAPQSSLPGWIPRVTFGGGRDVEKEPDEFQTTLTRIQRNRLGRHFFTTAEGHVWRQKKPEDIRAPKTLPADIILYQNVTGGLRLKILETNRSYPVQRVE